MTTHQHNQGRYGDLAGERATPSARSGGLVTHRKSGSGGGERRDPSAGSPRTQGRTGTGLDPERGRPLVARSGSTQAGHARPPARGGPPSHLRAAGDDWTQWESLYQHVYDGVLDAPDLFDDAAERFRDPFTTFDKWFVRIMAVALAFIVFAALAGWLR